MDYIDLYKQSIVAEDSYLKRINSILISGDHVAICSAPTTGEKRFFDYLIYKLKAENAFNTIEISSKALTLEQVIENVQMSKKKSIIVFPFYEQDIAYNDFLLNQLYQNFRRGEYQVVLALPWAFHLDPAKYQDIGSYVSNLIVRQPFTQDQTLEHIKMRKKLHGWEFDESLSGEVYRLTGGFNGLIKRLMKYYQENRNIDQKSLLENPAMVVKLAELAEAYVELPLKSLKELGIVDENSGQPKSILLKEYLSNQNITPKHGMPEKQRQLFNLFYANRNKLVTDKMIDEVVRSGKSASLWANYKLVSRLRKDLPPEFKIRTSKGNGYILSEK